MNKYDGKEFNDPIVRCVGCTKLVHRTWIAVKGGCNHCGNRRFQSISGMSEEEHTQLQEGSYPFGIKEYTIDPEFFNIFEQSEDI